MKLLEIKESWFEKDWVYYSPALDILFVSCARCPKFLGYGPFGEDGYPTRHWYFLVGDL
jgi:hypothetical protein